MTKSEMLQTLPTIYRKDKWVNQIYNEFAFADVNALSKSNYNNIFLTKLDDYGCSIYERDLLLDKKETIDDRRSVIITKWNSNLRCTVPILQNIVNQWFGDKCTVSYDGNAKVTHTTKIGTRYDPNSYTYSRFLTEYMNVLPAHFLLEWIHEHNRWVDYCTPHTWGKAKEDYYDWAIPREHYWSDEKYYIRFKQWQYNSIRTWDDVFDTEINWEE